MNKSRSVSDQKKVDNGYNIIVRLSEPPVLNSRAIIFVWRDIHERSK